MNTRTFIGIPAFIKYTLFFFSSRLKNVNERRGFVTTITDQAKLFFNCYYPVRIIKSSNYKDTSLKSIIFFIFVIDTLSNNLI